MNRRFQGNGASNIRAAVARARTSGRLNICNMQLVKIPDEVYDYYVSSSSAGTSVIDFDTSTNEERWWDKVDLTKIEASSNSITSIDADIANLLALASIDLHDNKICNISPALASLAPVLKFINLSRNALGSVPHVLCELTGLQELDLSHNALDALPDAVGNLLELRIMFLNDNNLSQLPAGISFMSKLTVVNLSNNQLKQLPAEIGSLLQLRQLLVAHNELTKLPNEISCLMHLEILDASSNKLQTPLWRPTPASANTKLHTLLLSNNRIGKISDDDIKALQLCIPLQTLDVGDNAISELSDKFYLLFQLTRLNVINNQLEELPNSIGLLPKLEHLLLDGNPLRRLRSDIVKRGAFAIKEFLRSRVPDDELQRMRLEMGQNAGGKSDLPSTLQGSAAVNNDVDKNFTSSNDASVSQTTVEAFFSSRSGSESRGKLLLSKTLLNLADENLWKIAVDNRIFHVDLSHNVLTAAPDGLSLLCRTITELDLSNNSITQLDIKTNSIATLKNLVYLNLSHNKLKSLFDDIPTDHNAEKPTGGDAENQNETYSNVLPILRELDISFNRFTSLPVGLLRNKSKLEILNAGNNRIRLLYTGCLRDMARLATLDLSNNDIDRVPPELGLCKSINVLKLEGNAFRVPRYDVLNKGTQAVMEYLRSRVAG